MTSRVACFVDGLNLYHAVLRMRDPNPFSVNLWSLASQFINTRTETLQSVHYFYAPLKKQKKEHMEYVSRLVHEGVVPVAGYFTTTRARCFSCSSSRNVNSEKESDVNLALAIFRHAMEDHYDRALVITNDADISPAIRQVRDLFPEKSITVLTTAGAHTAIRLGQVASSCLKISKEHLFDASFDEPSSDEEDDMDMAS